MEEITLYLLYLLGTLLIGVVFGIACWALARRKGRDTVGWLLTGLCFGPIALLVIALLPAVETHGQTRRCGGCGAVVPWAAEGCPGCGAALARVEVDPDVRVRRPLRSCFLYVSLFILLLLIVLGFIGYYCTPN